MALDYQPNPPTPAVPNYTAPISTGAGNYGAVTAPSPTPDGTSADILVQDIADRTGVAVTDAAAVLKYLQKQGLFGASKAAFMAQIGAAPTNVDFNTLLTHLQAAGLMATS